MSKNKNDNMVKEITNRDVDFAQWYTDVVKKADLADYSGVGGFIIYRPYGYAIWELMQKELDKRFKENGVENVYMPMMIPEGLLQREKDHVEGFAPEVAWVTKGGNDKLQEPLCVRPTSETLFCEHFAKIVQSYKELPLLYNQWCSVVRWEKTTRPFLRGREFLWQEGHTVHETAEEARAFALKILDIYTGFVEEFLAMPSIRGQKTEKEKFAGAKSTFGFENLMHDGKALQSGTTHDFGSGFAEAFGIQFTDKENKLQHASQSSWGVSTRLIGAVIMTHGDDSGLVLPPKVAPVQVVVLPIAAHKPGVLEKAAELREALKAAGLRVKLDDSDKTAGWKFSEYEMKGVPVRVEIGPKDMEAGVCVIARRDTGEKVTVAIAELADKVTELLDAVHASLYNRAKELLENKTYTLTDGGVLGLKKVLDETPGFVKAMWCGSRECEERIKEEATATSRVVPFEQERLSEVCFCCGEAAESMVYWGRAY